MSAGEPTPQANERNVHHPTLGRNTDTMAPTSARLIRPKFVVDEEMNVRDAPEAA